MMYNVQDKDKWLLINKKFSNIWPNITKKERAYARKIMKNSKISKKISLKLTLVKNQENK